MRLTDDWQGADFIAQHIDGTFLKVQLKGRLTLERNYLEKDSYVTFQNKGVWYLFPHDELLNKVFLIHNIKNTKSCIEKGGYSFPQLSVRLVELLNPYRIFPK